MNRKDFLNLSARAAFFLGVSPTLFGCKDESSTIETAKVNELLRASKALGTMVGFSVDPIKTVRVGMIGLGNRGSVLIQMFDYLVKNNYAQIVALSDLKEEKVNKNNTLKNT